jgi:hypothetical protein
MKITTLGREVAIASASLTDSTLTINTAAAHLLITGRTIRFDSRNGALDNKEYPVTVVDADTFTISVYGETILANQMPMVVGSKIIALDLLSTGQISRAYPNGSVTDVTKVFHAVGSVSASTGTATVDIQGSNDGTNWVAVTSISLASLAVTPSSGAATVTAPWAFFRINVSAITGTNAKVRVLMSGV